MALQEPEPITTFRRDVKSDYWGQIFRRPEGLPLPLLRSIGGILLGDHKQRFNTRTAPNGALWPALRFPRVTGGNKPLLDTGILRNSLTMDIHPDGASVKTNLLYAALHNFGGVITPKNSKFLAIPLTIAAKRAGSPRRYRGTLFYVKPKSRGGNVGGTMCEVQKSGRRSTKVVAVYLLLRSVTIPERRFMGLSANAEMQIDELLDEWVLSQQRSK
jgi:phage gpG-like protein